MPSASPGRAHRPPVLPPVLVGIALTLSLPPAAQESAPAPNADKGPAESHITIALGSQRQTVEGNPQRYWQYATPPSGTHIALVEIDHPLNDEGLVLGIKAYDLLEPSAGGVGYLYEVDAGVRVDTRYRRSQFYQDFYAGADHATRTDWRTDARWRVTPKDHLMGGYSTVRLRDGEENWRRENWRATYTREMGSLDASASVNVEQFSFVDGSPYLSGDTTTWSLGVGPSRDARTLIAGNVSGANTNLKGSAVSPKETVASLSGFHQLTDDLTLSGDLKYWEMEDSIARSAYAKRERLAAIEGEYIGLPKTIVRASFESADVDYVNGRQSQILRPSVNTGTVNIRVRPRKDVKLQLDLSRRRVDARPLAYNVGGYPVDTLIYSQADRLRVRGSWTPTFWPVGVTLGYQADQRENADRGLRNEIITRDLSAWWNVTEDVTATLSLLNQSYGLVGAGNPTPFVSNARSWAVGAAWRISDRTHLETSFTRADSFGGLELKQKTWSASLEHRWDEHAVRLGLALDDLTDYNGTLLGYDADLWYAEFSTRLP